MLDSKITSLFSYEFDDFQIKSCSDIEKNCHVLSLANTSAGKSTIAYYAILKSFLNNTRLVFTSPVKSLSNEKYNDLKTKFSYKLVGDILIEPSDFGLVTGDEKRNTNARILIMTTEIFRNLLFRRQNKNQDDIEKSRNKHVEEEEEEEEEMDTNNLFENLQFSVFDEAHYLNDPSRGSVYEECIWQLGKNFSKVQMIFLSATLSNPEFLVKWVNALNSSGRTLETSCTAYRPVPLEYYTFIPCPELFYTQNEYLCPWNELVKNNTLRLFYNTSTKAMDMAAYNASIEQYTDFQKYKRIYEKDTENKIILSKFKQKLRNKAYDNLNMLNGFVECLGINQLLPVIFFVLSKKKCNILAQSITGTYLNHEERKRSEQIFTKYIQRLNNYEQYDQVLSLKRLLLKGIATHHSDMLIILKEIVEMLFRENLIKVMFATETLAIGVNTPTKTVCFTELNKYEESTNSFRTLQGHELQQMAGRAGRRGLDDKGYVIYFPIRTMLSMNDMKSTLTRPSNFIESHITLCAETVLRHIFSLVDNLFQCTTTNEIAHELLKLFFGNSLYLETELVKLNLKVQEEAKKQQDQLVEMDRLKKSKEIILSKLSVKQREQFLIYATKAIEINFENIVIPPKNGSSSSSSIALSKSQRQKIHNEIVTYLFDLSKVEEKGFFQLCKLLCEIESKFQTENDGTRNNLCDRRETISTEENIKSDQLSIIYCGILEITNGLFEDQFFHIVEHKIVPFSKANFVKHITQCQSIVLYEVCTEFMNSISNKELFYQLEADATVDTTADEERENTSYIVTFLSILTMFLGESKTSQDSDNFKYKTWEGGEQNLHHQVEHLIKLAYDTMYQYEIGKTFPFSEHFSKYDELHYQNDLQKMFDLYSGPISYWVARKETFPTICKLFNMVAGNFYKTLQKLVLLLDEIGTYSKIENNIRLKLLCEESKRKIWYDILLVPSIYVDEMK